MKDIEYLIKLVTRTGHCMDWGSFCMDLPSRLQMCFAVETVLFSGKAKSRRSAGRTQKSSESSSSLVTFTRRQFSWPQSTTGVPGMPIYGTF